MGAPTPPAVTSEEAKVSKIMEDPGAYYDEVYEAALRSVMGQIDHRRSKRAKDAKAGKRREAATH
ncbi:hypothetical protein ABH940_005435 [Streptacidiphilus sp. BW17]|uniref:hypothetical protein n=1 Tax=Streptacidiphilus sp. BW17 TaxID=3156274 RepID=UPI003513A440